MQQNCLMEDAVIKAHFGRKTAADRRGSCLPLFAFCLMIQLLGGISSAGAGLAAVCSADASEVGGTVLSLSEEGDDGAALGSLAGSSVLSLFGTLGAGDGVVVAVAASSVFSSDGVSVGAWSVVCSVDA